MSFNVYTGALGPYNAIIGRKTIYDMCIIINFRQSKISWDDKEVAMKSLNELTNKENLFETILSATEPKLLQESTERASRILDVNYARENLAKIVKGKCGHLTNERKTLHLDCYFHIKTFWTVNLQTGKLNQSSFS